MSAEMRNIPAAALKTESVKHFIYSLKTFDFTLFLCVKLNFVTQLLGVFLFALQSLNAAVADKNPEKICTANSRAPSDKSLAQTPNINEIPQFTHRQQAFDAEFSSISPFSLRSAMTVAPVGYPASRPRTYARKHLGWRPKIREKGFPSRAVNLSAKPPAVKKPDRTLAGKSAGTAFVTATFRPFNTAAETGFEKTAHKAMSAHETIVTIVFRCLFSSFWGKTYLPLRSFGGLVTPLSLNIYTSGKSKIPPGKYTFTLREVFAR